MSGVRILIVDDDASVRDLLKQVFAARGYDVLCAEDGAAAQGVLDQERVDLVITDKLLPDMDGHTLIETLWRQHPYVGFIIITGYRSEQSEALARKQQVLAYLEKPFRDLTLIPRIVDGALEVHRKRLGRP